MTEINFPEINWLGRSKSSDYEKATRRYPLNESAFAEKLNIFSAFRLMFIRILLDFFPCKVAACRTTPSLYKVPNECPMQEGKLWTRCEMDLNHANAIRVIAKLYFTNLLSDELALSNRNRSCKLGISKQQKTWNITQQNKKHSTGLYSLVWGYMNSGTNCWQLFNVFTIVERNCFPFL